MLGVSVKTIYNKVVGLQDSALPSSAATRVETPLRIGIPCLHASGYGTLLSI